MENSVVPQPIPCGPRIVLTNRSRSNEATKLPRQLRKIVCEFQVGAPPPVSTGMRKSPKDTALLSLAELQAKYERGEIFTAPEWRRFDQLVARHRSKIRRADKDTGRLTAFEDRLPLAMKRILGYTVRRRDDQPVMEKEAEADCGPEETESHEGRREMSTKELIDYACEGCYHEAGHAIVRAYLQMPFVSVTIEFVEGVHAGFTDAIPRFTTTYQDFIAGAMFAAAGRVATDIYAESNPGMTRFDESDGPDQEFIDAKALQIRTTLGVDPEQWKAGIVARTEAILRTPYVWEAVEELAWQLSETEGAYAIPARQVRKILRKAKEKAAVHPEPNSR
jgi:hypothetical protein